MHHAFTNLSIYQLIRFLNRFMPKKGMAHGGPTPRACPMGGSTKKSSKFSRQDNEDQEQKPETEASGLVSILFLSLAHLLCYKPVSKFKGNFPLETSSHKFLFQTKSRMGQIQRFRIFEILK